MHNRPGSHAAPFGRTRRTAARDPAVTDSDPRPRTEQLANPFRPGNGVAPPRPAGRDALLEESGRHLGEARPLHANWTLTGIRGTGKTVLLGEFAARGERAGRLRLGRELGDRHRDARLAEPGLPRLPGPASSGDRRLAAGTAGQRVLDAMARAGGRAAALGLRRPLAGLRDVDAAVRRPVDRGLACRPARGAHGFALPLSGACLRRRAELTEPAGRR